MHNLGTDRTLVLLSPTTCHKDLDNVGNPMCSRSVEDEDCNEITSLLVKIQYLDLK